MCVRQRRHLDAIALQCLHESLRDAIALRALSGREAGLQAQLPGEDLRVLYNVGRAIVSEHLDDRGRAVTAEAALHGFEHDVADLGPADPCVDHGAPCDDFAVMGSFAANAAHELRTPLAGAIAQAQRLRAEASDPAVQARATEMEAALKGLLRVSERLMQLARAEGARLRSETVTDLRPVLKILVDEHQRRNDDDRILLRLPDAPVLSDLDPDALAIILRNLIDNALRHGDPHHPVEVSLTAHSVLRVANDGPVIPPETLAHLATRFARASSRTEGSALGLAIVSTIAERIGSRLELASPRPGSTRGFCADLTLPHGSAED